MDVHFIGIGGSGISALARMFLGEGRAVSGSDQASSLVTDELERLGAKIFIGHRAENLSFDTDLVIYTIAAPDNNSELLEARRRGVETVSYPEILGRLSAEKYTIAVAGTHGKTTTTAMVAQIMIAADLDPTVIVGSALADQKSNFIAGKSRYLVVEACEYRRSFLNLSPQVAVITNIDNDHLDYYRDLADIQSAFAEFAAKIPATGALICNATDPALVPVISATKAKIIDYSTLGGLASKLKLRVPGAHNVRNAEAALAVAGFLKINSTIAIAALNEFNGTKRRFEYRGKTKAGALIYDDYAHHPTEIRATLAGAREMFPSKRIVAIFQPHLYSRTKLLFDDFAKSFNDADEVIVAPIYAAREALDPSVDSEILAVAITRQGHPARAVADFGVASDYLRSLKSGPDDLILTLGAGDISQLAAALV